MVLKVESDDKMEPPIHVVYFLSAGAITLTLAFEGANAVVYFNRRSGVPGNNVDPPHKTILL